MSSPFSHVSHLDRCPCYCLTGRASGAVEQILGKDTEADGDHDGASEKKKEDKKKRDEKEEKQTRHLNKIIGLYCQAEPKVTASREGHEGSCS